MIKYKNFNISNNGNELIVINTDTNECKRKVVEDDCTFVYKVLKTKIKARGGVDGLLKFIRTCINEDFGTCYVNNIIKEM